MDAIVGRVKPVKKNQMVAPVYTAMAMSAIYALSYLTMFSTSFGANPSPRPKTLRSGRSRKSEWYNHDTLAQSHIT
jgi:hypothetical protein